MNPQDRIDEYLLPLRDIENTDTVRIVGADGFSYRVPINSILDAAGGINKAPVIAVTATGDIASFTDGADGLPMESVVAHIEPVQSGTGDPSPTNVRPISGWTGVTISYSGEDTSHPGTLYVSWQSEACVVYGGELDVTTGVLRVDRLKTTVAEQSWTYESAYRRFKATITNLKLGAVRQINVMADRFVTINDGRSESQVPNNAIYGAGSSSAVFVESSDYTDEAQFSNAYGACEIVYPLEIPVEYNIAPHQIDTLYGENNIWADTGDVNVTYRADTKLYIDNKVAEILNA